MRKPVLPMVLMLALAGCSSKTLTRDKAAEAIKESLFNEGAITSGTQTIQIQEVTNTGIPDSSIPSLRTYEKAGWITLVVRRCILFTCAVDVTLTTNGQAQSNHWKKGNNGVWTIATTRPEFIGVTGITNPEPTVAEVQYTSHRVPTEDGKALGIVPSQPEAKAILFRLFDDGWRVSE